MTPNSFKVPSRTASYLFQTDRRCTDVFLERMKECEYKPVMEKSVLSAKKNSGAVEPGTYWTADAWPIPDIENAQPRVFQFILKRKGSSHVFPHITSLAILTAWFSWLWQQKFITGETEKKLLRTAAKKFLFPPAPIRHMKSFSETFR